ncbi:MAG: beta-ketoacyl synthase chain length factor [Pseudomonadota bacterium]
MTTLTAYLGAASLHAPGTDGWAALSDAVASGAGAPDTDVAAWQPRPASLSPRQAKRLSLQTRLAILSAEDIADALPAEAAWVFASSSGEGETLHVILEAQATAEMLVSPVRFQNAVHNAAAGQWSIARSLTGPMTSIAAFDDSVAAGLLKAALQVHLERRAVGAVFFDAPLPVPLFEKRPIEMPMSASLALTPDRTTHASHRLRFSQSDAAPSPATTARGRALMATGNPVAAVLPLLEAVLSGAEAEVALRQAGGSALVVSVEPL